MNKQTTDLSYLKEMIARRYKIDDPAVDQFLLVFSQIDQNPDNWIAFEIYNPHDKDFVFTKVDRLYLKTDIMKGPIFIKLKAKSWAMFPHGYYKHNGDPAIGFVKNIGDMKGIGNTQLSAPEIRKQLF